MKLFRCHNCDQQIYFDNAQCLRCLSTLGYIPSEFALSALEPTDAGTWRAQNGNEYRQCSNNTEWQVCNWLLPVDSPDQFCIACSLNQTIPDLSVEGNLEYWRKLEQGKRRLIYSLMRLGLPIAGKQQDPETGLAFEFVRASNAADHEEDVSTGHLNGKVTVNVVEADDLERERIRLNLNEVYRSVLGHFRHESGHYYWWRLINESPSLHHFREFFGDERENYDEAIATYYRAGPRPNWQNSFLSAYASSHPWEDWAESWAHYLTIVDGIETAQAFGVHVTTTGVQPLFQVQDSYRAERFDDLLDQWLPLTYAVNSINRSAGQRDLYPFVLPGPAVDKLRFVHEVVKNGRDY